MRFIRSIQVLCLAATGTLLVACAGNSLRQSSETLQTELDRSTIWEGHCLTGIGMRQDGRILSLSNRAQSSGLRRDDQILTVDSKPFEDRTAFMNRTRQREAGDMVHLSVERQGRTRQIDVECHDSSNAKSMYRQLIAAMKDGDRAGCLQILSSMNAELALTSMQLWASYQCRFSGRSGKAQPDDLEAGYTLWRVKLEEATANSAALEAITPQVLRVIQWLQDCGNHGLAQELQYKLELAEHVTYESSHVASGGNETGPAASDQPQETPPGDSGAVAMSGTGFAVAPDGTVVTCAHVIKGSSDITVITADGIQHKASLLALNHNADLALLKAEAATPNYLALAAAEESGLGDKLFTIGFPVPDLLGINPKYSEGALAALSGFNDDPRLIQMSVPIQPGNSGGPVVNTHGRVVGVVDATMNPAFFMKNANGSLPQGVNYAVKSEFARTLLKDIGITPAAPNPAPNVTDAVRKAVVLIVAKGS